MYTNQHTPDWLRMCADLEHEESTTPAQRVRTEAVLLDPATAKAIDLSGLYRMTAEELAAVEAAMQAEEVAA